MNENKNGGVDNKKTRQEGAFIDRGKKNNEPHDQSVAGWRK